MVNKIFSFLHREVNGLHQAAYLLGAFALLSQVFALVRDRLLAHFFGAGAALDIYYAAFRIPDFIFITVASIVAISVVIPLVVDRLDKGKEAERELIDALFSFFSLVVIGAIIITFFLLPYLLPKIFPGFSVVEQSKLLLMSRVLLLSPLFLGLSNLFGSITQAYRRFFLYAMSPILYNIGIIVGILLLSPRFGVMGVVIGVVSGAFLHMVIQIPFITSRGLFPHIRFHSLKMVSNIFFLSLPRTLTLGMSHIVILFLLSIASLMSVGSISVFNFSYNLQSVPLSIIGVSYSLAAFPTLSRLYSRGEYKEFVRQISTAARHVIFWSIPIAVLFIVLRAQIVRTVLGSGQFTWSNTELTAACLALFAISVLFQSLTILFVRGFYAAGNTRTPLIVNVISSILTVIMAWVLYGYYQHSFIFQHTLAVFLRVDPSPASAILVLVAAFTIGSVINGFLLWFIMSMQFKEIFTTTIRPFIQSLIASLLMGIASYNVLNIVAPFFNQNKLLGIFSQGLCAGLVGIAVGLIILLLLKNTEIIEVWTALNRKFWKARVVGPGSEVVS